MYTVSVILCIHCKAKPCRLLARVRLATNNMEGDNQPGDNANEGPRVPHDGEHVGGQQQEAQQILPVRQEERPQQREAQHQGGKISILVGVLAVLVAAIAVWYMYSIPVPHVPAEPDNEHNHFTILVVGKMGTGKTTLVRGLCGIFNGSESNGSDSVTTESKEGTPMGADTKRVTPYSYVYKRINFTFIDTPGLKDVVNNTHDHKYLMQMDEPNVLIFTMKMTDSKFYDNDITTIKDISNAFGWKVWKKSIFVLTCANLVGEPDAKNERQNYSFYARRKLDFDDKITETLENLLAEPKVASNIPIIPVGLVRQPVIPSEEDKEKSWVDEFWKKVMNILATTNTTPTHNYGNDETEGGGGSEEVPKQDEEQPEEEDEHWHKEL